MRNLCHKGEFFTSTQRQRTCFERIENKDLIMKIKLHGGEDDKHEEIYH